MKRMKEPSTLGFAGFGIGVGGLVKSLRGWVGTRGITADGRAHLLFGSGGLSGESLGMGTTTGRLGG